MGGDRDQDESHKQPNTHYAALAASWNERSLCQTFPCITPFHSRNNLSYVLLLFSFYG